MKIPAIKKLVEELTLEELQKSEEQILNGDPTSIIIEGDDEGEQLTHVLAAIFILNDMRQNNLDFRTSLRNYSQKVRKSIG
jgi:hypothetical protein